MLAAIPNTLAGPRNVQRKNDKSSDSLANPRHRNIHPVSSSLADDKEANGGETRADCAQDYSPCSCIVDFNNGSLVNFVRCASVSVQNVRDVFQRVNEPEIYQLDLYPIADATNTIFLSADFLGNTSVTGKIYIKSISGYPNLVIDPLAFSSSQNSLMWLYIDSDYGFDFGLQKDFNILNGFNRLEGLYISHSTNFAAFQYLPPLPSLQILMIWYCPEINQIPFPDLSHAKLKDLSLYNNEISDGKADEIVSKLAASTSADSLGALILESNYLTRIPSQVGSVFPNLIYLFLRNNNISHIPSSSLTFASPYLMDLNLSTNGLKTIESGAFRGKATSTRAISFFFVPINRIIIRVLLVSNRKFHKVLGLFVFQ